jgi:tRNA-dihydrouridine synthase 2
MSLATAQEEANLLFRGELLAPMVRASTTPLRVLARQYGADATYTEELVDRALLSTTRVENKTLKTIDYVKTCVKKNKPPPVLLRIDPVIETKLICQLGTGSPALALQAAQHVIDDVSSIDINMGCPKKFSTVGGMGSALLRDPQRASEIVKTLSSLPKPVSCKIRLLDNTQATLDFIQCLVNAGANAIAIHGRHVGDEATQPAKWDMLREVVTLCKSQFTVPILVNGDFYTRTEFTNFLQEANADGVLLARPALYNTSIFRDELLPKQQVMQDYLRLATRYDMHIANTKYVLCEMQSHARTPIERRHSMPQINRIGETCACKSLPELCQLWNVKYSTGCQQQQASTDDRVYSEEYNRTLARVPVQELQPNKRARVLQE